MDKKLLLIVLTAITFKISYSQKNSEYFKIKEQVVTEGKTVYERGTFASLENYTAVVEIENKSATEMYQSALNWLQETYKNPEEVIKAKIENEYIRWRGISSFRPCVDALGMIYCQDVRWTIEVRFKEGRFKWDFVEFEVYTEPSKYGSGGWNSVLPTFRYKNHKNKVKTQEAKNVRDLRDTTNSFINDFIIYLKKGGTVTNDDNW
jgi:hypothetical protein